MRIKFTAYLGVEIILILSVLSWDRICAAACHVFLGGIRRVCL